MTTARECKSLDELQRAFGEENSRMTIQDFQQRTLELAADEECRMRPIRQESQYRTTEELNAAFHANGSRLDIAEYSRLYDELSAAREKSAATDFREKRPPAPERPAPAARTASGQLTMANVDVEKFGDALFEYLGRAIRPLADRIKALENNSALELAVHRIERQGEHLRRLESRLQILERGGKPRGEDPK